MLQVFAPSTNCQFPLCGSPAPNESMRKIEISISDPGTEGKVAARGAFAVGGAIFRLVKKLFVSGQPVSGMLHFETKVLENLFSMNLSIMCVKGWGNEIS